MKKLIPIVTTAISVVFFGSSLVSTAFAVADLRLNQDAETRAVALGVFEPSGELVRTLGLGSVRENVRAGGQQFIASFGQSPNGNLVLIASPDPENPREVIIRVNRRRIVISRDAVVTIIFPINPDTQELGEPLIRPGLVGSVTVDGRRLAPDQLVSLGTGSPVPIAQTQPPPPITVTEGERQRVLTLLRDGGFTGFDGIDLPSLLTSLENAQISGTLVPIPSSIASLLWQIGINLNPAAATPINPSQT